MNVSIDADVCTGHGRCYAVAPSVFTSDDSGFGVVVVEEPVDPELLQEVRAAVANCPEGAVTVTDTPTA